MLWASAKIQPNLPELNLDVDASNIGQVVDAAKQSPDSLAGPCVCPSVATCGAMACLSGAVLATPPDTTMFTYQGQLKRAGAPSNGRVDLWLKLYDAETGGNLVPGSSKVLRNVEVVNGLFAIKIDFGTDAFNGLPRWLEIAVRDPADPTDQGPYTALSPHGNRSRRPLTLFTRVALPSTTRATSASERPRQA